MLLWGFGIGLLGFVLTIVIPNIAALRQFQTLMTTMPALVRALGMEDAAEIATPEGFISAGYFGRILLILAVYTVFAGLSVTVDEEDQGIMDVLLSLPLPRWRIVLEKFAAHVLMLIVIISMGFLGLYLSGLTSPIQVDTEKLAISSVNVLPSALLMLSFTMFVGTLFRRKSQATAVAASLIIGSYVIEFTGSLASDSLIASFRPLSFFTYYDNAHVMRNGLNAGGVVLLLGLTVIFVIASVWAFQRRDIGI
jgi:ABC-2 type transport system permease protein